jgi:hypothetical protein
MIISGNLAALSRFIAFFIFVRSDMVSFESPVSCLPAFIVKFCLKTGPMPARVSPSSALALVQPGDAPPCDGRSGFVRAARIHKAGNDAGPDRKGN